MQKAMAAISLFVIFKSTANINLDNIYFINWPTWYKESESAEEGKVSF